MSYSYAKPFGVQSYVSGVDYSDLMKEALNPDNKEAENERLNISSSQEEYFKKQRLIQEAIAQLQSSEYVSPEIAKEVDVESLRKSLKDAKNGESTNVLGVSEDSQGAGGQSQLNAQNISLESAAVNALDKAQNAVSNALQDSASLENTKESKKNKQNVKQAIENDTLLKRMAERTEGFFDKHIFTTSPSAPSQVSERDRNAYNPLVIKAESAEGSTNAAQATLAVKFTDEVRGEEVSVPLTQENAEKLIEQFGSLEAASDYVKGFYYDAAYKMGYLSSDSDGDGKISLEEGVNLKTLVSLMSGEYSSVSEKFGGNVEAQKKFLEQVGFIDNLADFINHSISQDSNFDGGLSLNEVLNGANEAVFLKTVQGGNSESVEVLVIRSFKIDLNRDSFNDTLLNLGAKAEDSTQMFESQKIKELLDINYLKSLDEATREQLLKSETLLKNLLVSV